MAIIGPNQPQNRYPAGQPGQMNPQGAQPRPVQGTQPYPPQGAQPRPVQGTQPYPPQGAQPRPAQGTQPYPPQGAQPRPAQGTQSRPTQGNASPSGGRVERSQRDSVSGSAGDPRQ